MNNRCHALLRCPDLTRKHPHASMETKTPMLTGTQMLQSVFIPPTVMGLYVQWTPGHNVRDLQTVRVPNQCTSKLVMCSLIQKMMCITNDPDMYGTYSMYFTVAQTVKYKLVTLLISGLVWYPLQGFDEWAERLLNMTGWNHSTIVMELLPSGIISVISPLEGTVHQLCRLYGIAL